jgi:hypothetical protein
MGKLRSKVVNEKEDELLRLVASLIVQIILNQEDERNRLYTDQREGSVDLFPSVPGTEDKGVLRSERTLSKGNLRGQRGM